ncbi:MAG: hypothetical protein R6X20_08205 [Phycisphaerae bacterium]
MTLEPQVLKYEPYYAKRRWAGIRATEHRLRRNDVPRGRRFIRLVWPGEALLDHAERTFRRPGA